MVVKKQQLIISVAMAAMSVCLAAPTARGAVVMQGVAEVDYIKYDASVSGKDVLNGSTLAQKYSLLYSSSNYYFREQPRYYDFAASYNITDLNTKITDLDRSSKVHETFGKFDYSGAIGFNPPDMPIKFKAYRFQNSPMTIKTGLTGDNLIQDNLLLGIDKGGTQVQSGASFAFEPQQSRNPNLYGLPRFLIDYRETTFKKSDSLQNVDNRTRQLAVAGLNKENNWLNYRTTSYENFINPLDNYTRQEIQIGHIDNGGNRKWASLTNWIEVSADGQLTTHKTSDLATTYEEYDLNFLAVATRNTWNARTFTNYNRHVEPAKITENANIPIYIRGIYGLDTDWYVNLATRHGSELQFATNVKSPTFANSIGVGGTTFKRAEFTLSPAISLENRKDLEGFDSYSFSASIESASTKRFSDKLGLVGKISWAMKDDGHNASDGNSWSNTVDLKADYKPNSASIYSYHQQLEYGSGSGFLTAYTNQVQTQNASNSTVGNYYRSLSFFSAGWNPVASFSTGVSAYFNAIMAAGQQMSKDANFTYNLIYNKTAWQLRANTKYTYTDNGISQSRAEMVSFLEVDHRLNRNHDSMLRVTHNYWNSAGNVTNSLEILQRYNYNIFSRTGVNRNIATISEEFNLKGLDLNGTKTHTKYLLLTGRYLPTEKLSLYGHVKYEYSSPNATVIYYRAGIDSDFKLLSTSLEYSYAKRDVDNRVEKRLSATVKRVF